MNQLVQHSLLLPYPFLKTFLIGLLISTGCIACSKKEASLIPGKPAELARKFEFDLVPANQFDDETSRQISLKLRLTVTGIDLVQNKKQNLSDTIITRQNLYEFTHQPGEAIKTTITTSTDDYRHLLFNYVIVYNHNGALVTRSESAGLRTGLSDKIVVKL